MVSEDDFVKTIKIRNYQQLINILQGQSPNFREKYIFRGLGSVKYKLIPSALRKDKNGEYIINNYIDSKFCLKFPKLPREYFDEGNISFEEYNMWNGDKMIAIPLNKYGNRVNKWDEELCTIFSENEFKFKRELYVLLKFLNWADRTGLKINTNNKIRKLIDENLNYDLGGEKEWPDEDFFEIISLAQHYGIPTEALDWSYDYKVSLYFATRNILENNDDDCVLWAFNYDFMKKTILPNHPFPYRLHFYRPEYYTNPNLRAQKGLFTFIINKNYNIDERPFEKIFIEDMSKNICKNEFDEKYVATYGLRHFMIPKHEKLFYKFIIPGNLKHKILDELYLDGYSEDYLFPGYMGVVLGIENKVKLDNYKQYLSESPKQNILMQFSDTEINNISKNRRYLFRKNKIKGNIDKIFMYSNDSKKVFGYFNISKIIKNSSTSLWDSFKNDSAFDKNEFNCYFKNNNVGYAIKINNLVLFEYPIKVYMFKFKSEFIFISKFDRKLNFLLNF